MAKYLLIKGSGCTAKGASLSARDAALALLKAQLWPLWEHTRNRQAIQQGDSIAVYISGDNNQQVIAQAKVTALSLWTASIARSYPLMLDGTPFSVLHLGDIKVFEAPVRVVERLSRLSFVNPESKKWGVAFMGGVRALSDQDFALLTENSTET